MTNTYAINTTRNEEFSVRDDLKAMGVNPWVPCRLGSRYIKEARAVKWYDTAYVPKLMFAVIPAILWRDVVEHKHVIGKPVPLSRLDIKGTPAHVKQGTGAWTPAVPGLNDFRNAVEAEYADAKRAQENSEYQCQYQPGQALELLTPPWDGFTATFSEVIRHAHDDYAKLRVEVDMFGRKATLEVDPDRVRSSA